MAQVVPTFTLAGQNVFRLQLKASVSGLTTKSTFSWLSDPVYTSVAAGNRGGNSFWTLEVKRTTEMEDANFYLCVFSKWDLQLQVERQLSVIDPSGARIKEFDILADQQLNPEVDSFLGALNVVEAEQKGWLFGGEGLNVRVDFRIKINRAVPLRVPVVDSFLNMLKSELSNPAHSDFTLVSAGGHQIKTHKLLLRLASPVFRRILQTDCPDTRHGICKIDDASGDDVRAMLACILGGDVDALGAERVMKLLKLADKYELLEVKEKCALKLASEINMDNVVDLMVLADQHCVPNLKTDGFIFLEDNAQQAIIRNVVKNLIDISESLKRPLYEEWRTHMEYRMGVFTKDPPNQERTTVASEDTKGNLKRKRAD